MSHRKYVKQMLLLFSIGVVELPPVRKELFIRFRMRVFRECLALCVCASPVLVPRAEYGI